MISCFLPSPKLITTMQLTITYGDLVLPMDVSNVIEISHCMSVWASLAVVVRELAYGVDFDHAQSSASCTLHGTCVAP